MIDSTINIIDEWTLENVLAPAIKRYVNAIADAQSLRINEVQKTADNASGKATDAVTAAQSAEDAAQALADTLASLFEIVGNTIRSKMDVRVMGNLTASEGIVGEHGVAALGIIETAEYEGGGGGGYIPKTYSEISGISHEHTNELPTAYALKMVLDALNVTSRDLSREVNARVNQMSQLVNFIQESVIEKGIVIGNVRVPIDGTISVTQLQQLLSLGTAATFNSEHFATSEQGAKADTALQPADVDITEGNADGSLMVMIGGVRKEVKPKGVNSAAMREENFFAKSGDLKTEQEERMLFEKNTTDIMQTMLSVLGGLSQKVDGMQVPITQEQYDALPAKEKRLYFIVNNKSRLMRIYYGVTLVARRKEGGEDVAFVFPAVFPMIFG